MAWLIDTERLQSCETVEALRTEMAALINSGVPSSAVFERFNLAAWYHERLTSE